MTLPSRTPRIDSRREIGEKEVLLGFLLGSAVLAVALNIADGTLERRTREDMLKASALAGAALSRRAADSRRVPHAATAPSAHGTPVAARYKLPESAQPGFSGTPPSFAPDARHQFSEPERHAYFSLIAALDIQGKPEELAHIFMGTIRQESSFNPRAMHPVSGAKGLSQLMDDAGATYGLSRSDFFDPVRNLQAFVEYFYANTRRFTAFPGVDSAGKRMTITRDEAIKYSLIAHNLGPTALEALLRAGYGETKADGFIRLIKERIAENKPVRYRNRYRGQDELVTVAKMVEVVGFYDKIMHYSGMYRNMIAKIDDVPGTQEVAFTR